MMIIDERFTLWQTVYLKTDLDQYPRTVTGIVVRGSNHLMYKLTYADSEETTHYDAEISETKIIH